MYVRLAFAVAAHLEPEILIVDEVLAVGDAEFQKKCLGKMEEVAETGRTVLFVSHNMPVIAHLCERGILLRNGIVTADGAARKVIESYLADSSRASVTPLAERTDRSGNGEIIVTRIEFRDPEGGVLEQVMTGQPLHIRLHYQCRPGRRLKDCRATLVLNRGEQVYVVLSTWMVDEKPLHLEDNGYVDLILTALPLTAGTYSLDSILESNEVHDVVNYAAELPVEDGDFFGTGRIRPGSCWQNVGVLVKHTYRRGTPATQPEQAT